MIRLFRLPVALREQLRHAGVLAAGKGEKLLAESGLMQEIDRTGINLHQHILGHQLIQIVAGGVSLHRKTPGQVAGGEDLAQVIRIKKIGLILQKSQQFRFTHDIPLFTLQRLMMREIHQALALNSLFAVRSTKKTAPKSADAA